MKHIVKQSEPQELLTLKASGNDDWIPSYSDLDGGAKVATKDALMAEQGYICCYCERRLTPDDSHIEHFKPQSDKSVDPLDYSNMLCSCQNILSKEEPLQCGHRKGNVEIAISPLEPSCEARFSFTGDGRIDSATPDDTAAINTIETLGLAIPKLNASRAMTIEPFLESDLTEAEVRQFVSGYLQQDNQGSYGEFWTTIQYLFGGYAAR